MLVKDLITDFEQVPEESIQGRIKDILKNLFGKRSERVVMGIDPADPMGMPSELNPIWWEMMRRMQLEEAQRIRQQQIEQPRPSAWRATWGNLGSALGGWNQWGGER